MKRIFEQIKQDIENDEIYPGYGFLQGTYDGDLFGLEMELDGDYFIFVEYWFDYEEEGYNPQEDGPKILAIRIPYEKVETMSIEELERLYYSERFYSDFIE